MLQDIQKVKDAAASVKFNSGSSSSSTTSSAYDGFSNGGWIQRLQKGGQAIMAAAGQYFPGYGGGDKIPIMGEAGEVMIRKERQKEVGVDTTLAYNRGDWKTVVQNLSKKLQLGGPVSPSFPRMAFAGGGLIPDISQSETTETSRKYYIQGNPIPISVRANNNNANRLLNQLQEGWKRRSS
jgi:hypothetical protein